ncbi:MAG: hypothetical protein UR98_C0040G0019 [Parcubacteria group bacterium GW2011_GWA1_36_12]|nr:MAG: hypothetical protein UR98_C0040G0019 [Parcubacteria group bacterium GW2011_GWA1_36_12]
MRESGSGCIEGDSEKRVVFEDLEVVRELDKYLRCLANNIPIEPDDYTNAGTKSSLGEAVDTRRALVYRQVVWLFRAGYEYAKSGRDRDFEGLESFLERKIKEYDVNVTD